MIKRIDNLDKYYSFINSFDGDLDFSDPHLNEMKESHEDISKWINKPNHYCFVVESDDKTLGFFVFIIYEDEKYIEMIAGLSKEEAAVEDMLVYLENNYPGFKADFVFNPHWSLLKKGLEKRGAHFDIEQQRMVYTHQKLDINTNGIVLYSDKYKDQYIEIHDQDLYWTAEKVIIAKKRFNIYLAIENDVVLGYLDVTHCFDENEPYSFYVRPAYRRKGIGRKLLYKALIENEPKEMMLFVDVDNTSAIKLYESLGFVKKEHANTQTANLHIKDNNTQTFIWDLDGTLLDSYEIIVTCLIKTYKEFGVTLKKEDVLKGVIGKSVSDFVLETEKKYGVSFSEVRERYSEINYQETPNITAMKHAKEILEYLRDSSARNFVFTHRGKSTREVLSKLGLLDYFEEIITGKDNFPRKPDPSAINYLVEKYHLNRENTYYVGDRTIDVECAKNAHIKSIMFLPDNSVAIPTGQEDYVVKDLFDIKDILR